MVKVLVACEESQAVTKAFRKLGHDAFSCDLLPCSGGHPEWHYQCDIDLKLEEGWDIVIAFPPCTHLAGSGARWFEAKKRDGRQQAGIDFFMKFVDATCPRVAIENPIGIMSTEYRKPDQIIQPYHHGHEVTKSTCLWLKGLPLLVPTNVVERGTQHTFDSGRVMSDWYRYSFSLPLKQRAVYRSKTFEGIAKAMAEQWSV